MLRLKIDGMRCANCEVLIERRFRKIAGVRRVKVSSATGMAEINCYSDIDVATLQHAIGDDGYTVWLLNEQTSKRSDSKAATNTGRDYVEIAAAFIILFGLYLLLGQFDVISQNLTLPNEVSYGLALLIGVVASMSTCIAVTGGLLLAVAAKYNSATAQLSAAQRFKPHLFFNAGRVVSYTLLGGAIGALGSTFSMSAGASALLMILASILMIVVGLQMLNLFPWLKRLQPRMPKMLAHKIHDLSENKVRGGAFLLGASTFFLPCGFTQALQLYVLAKGSFTTGVLTMLAFSLGTLPALISLSALSSFAKGSFQRYFLKFAGVAVVILGLFNIQSGLTLTAVGSENSAPDVAGGPIVAGTKQATPATEQPVPIVDGKQIVDMKIVGYRYEPNRFAVVQGIPVEWRIDASKAAGCGRILLAPRAGVRKLLPFGTTVIAFTPKEPGDIVFNCSMGMMTRGSKITVLASAKGNAEAMTPENPARPTQPQAFSTNQRGEIERITREYLVQHPEVLQEAIAVLEKRQQTADAEAHQAAVKENAATLFGSQHQVVLGNPQGDVTMVEFFDYNCAYCKRALADMLDLLKADAKLKVVLKEFPVLGEGSTQAAQVAVAVRMQDETGRKYLEFHQKLLAGRGQADRVRALAVAKDIGLDMKRLENDLASEEVKAALAESMKLAEALGLNGTPSYVVGSDVVVGAIGLDGLREKVSAVRK
jgi:protein-disulfide isomerase/sulfite exporter TauE/SafE/copper chaperone CopZ